MLLLSVHTLANIFGIIGNVVSIGVFLSPMPTFYMIYKKKSSEGYQSIPYAVALFSAMILLYYGSLKTNGFLLITINSFGCAIEVLYLLVYLVYAPTETKKFTLKLIILLNLGACSSVVLLTSLLAKGSQRVAIVGWINVVINICVFVAPLGVMKRVIETRSVEFMPFSLSFFLTLNAVAWFFYGFLLKDYYIAAPNILGILLGMGQMSLYTIVKCMSRKEEERNSGSDSKEVKKGSDLKPENSHVVQVESDKQIEFKMASNTTRLEQQGSMLYYTPIVVE